MLGIFNFLAFAWLHLQLIGVYEKNTKTLVTRVFFGLFLTLS
jgi:hypothetical membrane protein